MKIQIKNSISTITNSNISAAHLFTIGGQKWRNLRAKFTPTFTPGKLRMMLPTLLKCGSTLEEYVKEHNLNKPLDMKKILCKQYKHSYRFVVNFTS